MPNFTQYVVPGVYVATTQTPVIAPVGVQPALICLIGTGIGYNTFSETISFASSNTATLTKNGIDVSSIVVTGYVPDPNAASNALPATFVADVTGGSPSTHDYGTSQTGSGAASVTTINRETSGHITTTYPMVTVTYHYTDADYHNLNFFDSYASFTEAYGPAFDPTSGALVSPLSLAAQIAMQNGANQLYAIALEGGSPTVAQQFADAYALLSSTNKDANLIVPLWDGITDANQLAGMLTTLKAFVEGDSNNQGILRMAFVGFDQGFTTTPASLATMALGVSSERVVMAWPNQLNFYNGITFSTMVLDGFYLATSFAALLVAQAPQVPLTRKYPQSFTGFPLAVAQALTTSAKNQMSSSGISVCETDRNSRIVVRHGLTTDYVGGELTREISLVRAQDALYMLIDSNLDAAALIGTPITATTPLQIKSVVSGGLETAVSSGLIVDYNSLAVRQQQAPSGDPTVIEVQFAYLPAWPLNYILVNFTVDTTTGTSNLAASNALGTSGATTPDQSGDTSGSN